MKINLLAFGMAEEIIGEPSISIQLTDEATALGDLTELLVQEYPALARIGSFALTVNQEYVSDDTTILKPTDEVAIIPPVSGG